MAGLVAALEVSEEFARVNECLERKSRVGGGFGGVGALSPDLQ